MKILKKLSLAAASVSALFTGVVAADIVHLDDVIIEFSLCVGNDCVNGESFGFDTIRLKENNLRMHFQDTSSTASFPSNDWRLLINDTSNGGSNYFSIQDSDSSRRPFTLEAGARANALYVDADGDVGFGTATPVVNLHAVDGNTPTLRLEQNGSAGFTPQTYDIASNEANFFIRDVTNGSTLFFRAKPGAPENSLFIDVDGVGVGTANPSTDFHVVDTGAAQLRLENTDEESWNLNSAGDGTFRISDVDAVTAVTEFELSTDGDLTISGNLITAGTVCSTTAAPGGCDYVFDSRYELDSIEEHAEKMWKNKFLPAVGPTKENAPFDVTAKTGAMLNELEKAHIYIDQLNQRVKQRDDLIASLHERVVKLEQKN